MTEKLSPRALMEKLVSFSTVSRDSNLPLIDWVEGYLIAHGVTAHRMQAPGQPEKAALFAHAGPWQEGAVVLSGHSDVVPVDGQTWDTDPFEVVEAEGRYYGRGTCDMKGFDALAIWALVEAQGREMTTPLQLALSYDEEIGCIGAPHLIRAMEPVVPKGRIVIVGEPSMMQVVTGHKGDVGLNVHVHGFEVHSSLLHQGVSAVHEAARLIDWANQRNRLNRAAPRDATAALFDPPWTTQHVGTIEGGTASNITAKDCWFFIECRTLPGVSLNDWKADFRAFAGEVEAEMQEVHPDAHIEISDAFQVPGLVPEEQGVAEALARALTGDNGTHVVSYGTEAGQFQDAGYSVIICGPGDIAQAHQANEFLSVEQFRAGQDFMIALLDHLSR
ncbi:acetylornithine deacetylase [Ruegeria hyattellae]|uniref:acetylornithine deacetylase n=1 Tax=Ruegeria hyattellae TaxID=3233337 RepID=UPI00355C4DF6